MPSTRENVISSYSGTCIVLCSSSRPPLSSSNRPVCRFLRQFCIIFVFFFFLMNRPPPRSPLFPYTPLFRSQGIPPAAFWQVLFDPAAELLMHEPGILSLHAQTTANTLHYAYRVCGAEQTQQLTLLQCAAFIEIGRAHV